VAQLHKDGIRPTRVFMAERKEDLRRRVADAEDRAIEAINMLADAHRHIGAWFAGIAFVAFVFGFILGYRLS
jgi:hypothetical protein